MSLETIVSHQQEGIAARLRGLGHDSNPFLARELLPQATGEPAEEWRSKAEAWLFGWLIENAWRQDDP
ncbi:CrpP-related protein [Pseudorhizobium flavum]|uniref:Uncharacterized protein n=1 Tax=Pseudorhizobium flavum TaxID=1335061 RepID=A0A7W9YUK4_9HYPH|nr:CrpP-related protein [Pseudorhizobium flavum]MBB6178552.1 hypothetical protein [Pseudorhizobium flavum]CAD6610460.1 hypothetical protein RFYW14_02305 [Pseudorhizobium flavum]